MVVYIEEIFLQGFADFFIVFFLAVKSLASKSSRARIFLACMICAGIYTLSLVYDFGGVILLALMELNLLLGVLIVFSGFSLLFSAFVVCNLYMLVVEGINYSFSFLDRTYNWIITAVLFVYFYLLLMLLKHFYNIKKHKKFEYKLTFYNGNNIFSTIGYLDSGNFLQDSLTGLPVVIVDYDTFLHTTGYNLNQLFSKSYNLKNAHYIDYLTISGRGKLLVFEIDKVEMEGKVKQCLLGFSMQGGLEYSALISVGVL